jgi:hypothetical protein
VLARITPIANADHDSRLYECPACGNVNTALVQFKLQSLEAQMQTPTTNDESRKHRKSAADHLRKSLTAGTPAEKAEETRMAKSYKTMAENEEWLVGEKQRAAERNQ